MSHVRSRLVVAAIAALALAGCAVPGQGAPAGTATEYQGATITNADVDATFTAWAQETQGALISSRDEVLTMELLHDDLLAACAERGTPIHSADSKRLAQQWFEGLGIAAEPSDDFVYAFESQFAIAVLAIDGGDAELKTIIENAAANAKVSPRNGEISVDAFLASVADAKGTAEQQQLGAQSYIPFQHVNAFVDADSSWVARG
ncbi:hypothetical protein [Demequina aurantiaca]|uniref:hypothetical protein n=1 Tax=Demequina aurantiaca TaxID=676200 RepID=UPI000781EFFC|nr:hypothetical protein [Demequina aurantiaca]